METCSSFQLCLKCFSGCLFLQYDKFVCIEMWLPNDTLEAVMPTLQVVVCFGLSFPRQLASRQPSIIMTWFWEYVKLYQTKDEHSISPKQPSIMASSIKKNLFVFLMADCLSSSPSCNKFHGEFGWKLCYLCRETKCCWNCDPHICTGCKFDPCA